jgi:hypothetical protein
MPFDAGRGAEARRHGRVASERNVTVGGVEIGGGARSSAVDDFDGEHDARRRREIWRSRLRLQIVRLRSDQAPPTGASASRRSR